MSTNKNDSKKKKNVLPSEKEKNDDNQSKFDTKSFFENTQIEDIKIVRHCDICNLEAKVLCNKCNKFFCESCSKFVHEKEFNKNHQIESITKYIQIENKCPEHPTIPMILFCTTDQGKLI